MFQVAFGRWNGDGQENCEVSVRLEEQGAELDDFLLCTLEIAAGGAEFDVYTTKIQKITKKI